MKIICLILARGGSKGIPRKNIKLLNGKPLLSYVLSEAKKLPYPIYVSTENKEIAEVAREYGAEIIDRPPELAQDDSKSIDAVQHALSVVGADLVVLLNACTPFVLASDIEECIKMANGNSVVSLVESFESHPSKVCFFQEEGEENRIYGAGESTRWWHSHKDWYWRTGERQKLPKTYRRNTAIYVASKETIMSGTFFGKDTRGYVMPKERSLDLNDNFDWKIAEFLCK